MSNLTSPLGLLEKLKSNERSVSPVPFLDIILIVVLLAMLGSRFIYAPGIAIDLPKSSSEFLTGKTTSAVLTVNQSNMLFFEGNIFNFETIENVLKEYVEKAPNDGQTLLLKMGQNVQIDVLFKLSEVAKKAGFEEVQLAGSPTKPSFERTPY